MIRSRTSERVFAVLHAWRNEPQCAAAGRGCRRPGPVEAVDRLRERVVVLSPTLRPSARCPPRPAARCTSSTSTAHRGRCDAPGRRPGQGAARAAPARARRARSSHGRAGDPPADDAPGIGVDHEGDVDKAGPGGDVGEVRHPERIGPSRLELAVHPIEWTGRRPVVDPGFHGLSSDGAFQTHLSDQPRHGASRHLHALPAELPDLAHAVDLEVLLPDRRMCSLSPASRRIRGGAAAGSARGQRGCCTSTGDRQHPADRLDPVDAAMIVDEGDHGLNRRSSSASANRIQLLVGMRYPPTTAASRPRPSGNSSAAHEISRLQLP